MTDLPSITDNQASELAEMFRLMGEPSRPGIILACLPINAILRALLPRSLIRPVSHSDAGAAPCARGAPYNLHQAWANDAVK